jgi:hypothetical protein
MVFPFRGFCVTLHFPIPGDEQYGTANRKERGNEFFKMESAVPI